jgi:hypothetical protein
MLQKETSNNGEASLLILTHEAKEGSVKESIDQIEALDCVKDKAVLLRVEDL